MDILERSKKLCNSDSDPLAQQPLNADLYSTNKQQTKNDISTTPLMYNNLNPISSRIASARPKNSSQRVSFNLPVEDVLQSDGSRTTGTGDSSGHSN